MASSRNTAPGRIFAKSPSVSSCAGTVLMMRSALPAASPASSAGSAQQPSRTATCRCTGSRAVTVTWAWDDTSIRARYRAILPYPVITAALSHSALSLPEISRESAPSAVSSAFFSVSSSPA